MSIHVPQRVASSRILVDYGIAITGGKIDLPLTDPAVAALILASDSVLVNPNLSAKERAAVDRFRSMVSNPTLDGDAYAANWTRLFAMIGDMQNDISTIKADVATIKADVATIKADVATIKADVSQMKTSGENRCLTVHDMAVNRVNGGREAQKLVVVHYNGKRPTFEAAAETQAALALDSISDYLGLTYDQAIYLIDFYELGRLAPSVAKTAANQHTRIQLLIKFVTGELPVH